MIGRRAFARGNSLWARAFNQQLPRRISSCSIIVPSMKCLSERPLHGFAEQYRDVNSLGFMAGVGGGEEIDEADDKAETLADIINSVASINNTTILRNWLSESRKICSG